MVCSAQQVWLLVDPNEEIEMEKTPIIKVASDNVLFKFLPGWI